MYVCRIDLTSEIEACAEFLTVQAIWGGWRVKATEVTRRSYSFITAIAIDNALCAGHSIWFGTYLWFSFIC